MAKSTSRWDQDESDDDGLPAPPRGPPVRRRDSTSPLGQRSSSGRKAAGSSPKSPLSDSYATTSTGPGPERDRENRIVLGLDYGTTATGLAWMQQKTTSAPTFADVKPFVNWRDGAGNPKVPSEISYSKGSNANNTAQHKRVLHWTKLELEARRPVAELEALRDALDGLRVLQQFRSADNPELTHVVPRHLSKTPTDIVKDFLLTVAREFYSHMNKSPTANALAKGPSGVSLDIIITHPAEWAYEPLNKLYLAVMGAFHKLMFPTRRSVYFVTEPEACALFTVQRLISTNEANLIPGDCFVICDAGGGTVDLVTYKMDSVDPLEISRVGVVTGANCGATCIDRAFLRWIKSMATTLDIGDDDVGSGGHFLLTEERKVLLGRFEPLKRQFTGEEDNTLQVARGVVMQSDAPNYKHGMLKITAADMRRFFEESVNGTLGLIARQVEGATAEGEYVTKIFMSGGLSQSNYLFRRVEDWAHGDAAEIEVKRPSECWTAVAQGAVLRGAGLGATAPRPVGECPRHYGIAGSELWSPQRHTDRNGLRTDNVHGRRIIPGQITWLVRKGDVILPDKAVEVRQRVTCSFHHSAAWSDSVARITFCATALKEPPILLEKLPAGSNEISTLDVKLDDVPSACRRSRTNNGASYIKVLIDVVVRVGYDNGKGVSVEALCDGETMARYYTGL